MHIIFQTRNHAIVFLQHSVIPKFYTSKSEKWLYRPSMTVTVIVFLELKTLSLICSISLFLCAKYAGWFGVANVVHPFSKLNTTEDMNGLSSGFSWTHKSPTWMQSKASSSKQLSIIDVSTKSFAFPCFQRFHAWENHITHLDCKTLIFSNCMTYTFRKTNNGCLRRLLSLDSPWCDQYSLSSHHLQPPKVTHQSYRRRTWQRKCPPLHTQEPCSHWLDHSTSKN